MRNPSVSIMLVGAVLLAGWPAVETRGQSDRELEERLDRMRQQAKELAAASRSDEAERVEQTILRLQEEARHDHEQERGDRPDLGEAKQRLAELKRHLAELKEQGRGDQAERVARQIEEIRQHLERGAREGRIPPNRSAHPELEERLADAKRRIAELKEAGRHDEADRLAHEARQMMRRAPGTPEGDGRAAALDERIGHIREAARHLHAAGLHDVADNLLRQAEEMAAAARAEGPQLARRLDELGDALREVRQKIERMDKQMQELNERIERR
jgi:chromosome segregation protein